MKHLPVEERPRERLLRLGPTALSSVELIAILLGTGRQDRSVMEIATLLLHRLNGLRGISHLRVEDMRDVSGIGPAKAVRLMAALELGRRVSREKPVERFQINRPGDIADLLLEEMRHLDREHLKVVLLDTKHRVLDIVLVSVGHLNGSLVHPREVFKPAIRQSAACIVVVHNHPSGDPAPSEDDVAVTKRLVRAGELLGIDILDHIVIGDGRYVSLKELNLM